MARLGRSMPRSVSLSSVFGWTEIILAASTRVTANFGAWCRFVWSSVVCTSTHLLPEATDGKEESDEKMKADFEKIQQLTIPLQFIKTDGPPILSLPEGAQSAPKKKTKKPKAVSAKEEP